ncbi:MAG: Flp family type IVb pilin [Actinobacteria bacterium]|nr:Flp family type IVb pilin [Actinomycetota bacterium]
MFTLPSMVSALRDSLRTRLRSDAGIEAIEYALIAALLSAIVVAAVALLNPGVNNIFTQIAAQLNAAATAITPN